MAAAGVRGVVRGTRGEAGVHGTVAGVPGRRSRCDRGSPTGRRADTAGIETGDFAATDPETTARAVFQATGRFHDPCHAREWEEPGAEADFTAVVDLLARGLRP
ncbi:hypothetical protein ACIP4U_02870 [Streptomyces caelestis]|uniref:hypothetical protein n=1 Tax=Streptomyces caelestis TaxID=36816 RepID=UPI00161746AB|nr:hypothetical protein GCM10010320_05560 [Streptomyces caelestis]